jgi:LEA14-like dessication related protein
MDRVLCGRQGYDGSFVPLLPENVQGREVSPRDWQPFWGLRTNVHSMPILKDPVITLEDIRLLKISFSNLELDVTIQVKNPNPLGITLRELPFTVLCSTGNTDQQIASGNTGRVKITGNGSTVLHIPVTSQNAALIGALATFVTKGGIQVTIRGTATVDAFLLGWSVPFEKTLPVTMKQVTDSLAGERLPDNPR